MNPGDELEAFSKDGRHRDTSMFRGSIVEHTTSWLTINPYKGCSLGCAYCFRARWHSSERPVLQTDVHLAIEELINHPDFKPHITPLSMNVSSTDALLPKVRESTFGTIRALEEMELTNPVGITTKLEFSMDEIELLASLNFVRPMVFVSLAFIPHHIEPIGTAHRIRNLQNLAGTSIPTVHYFRPIVAGWNDADETLDRALSVGNRYADAICIGSLRMSPEIRRELDGVGVSLPGFADDFHSKNFESAIYERIIVKYHEIEATVPLFKHTSCAVSYFVKKGNYNLLFEAPERNCTATCPADQQGRCRSRLGLR